MIPRPAEMAPALAAKRGPVPHRRRNAAPVAEAALQRLCAELREGRSEVSPFDLVAPEDWSRHDQDDAERRALVERIAGARATTSAGLRAKAAALSALLGGCDGELYADAAMPDRLAWSLVQDILAT